MQALGRQLGAPLEEEARRFSSSAALGTLRSAGRALTAPKADRIPPQRREALLQVCGCGGVWVWRGVCGCGCVCRGVAGGGGRRAGGRAGGQRAQVCLWRGSGG